MYIVVVSSSVVAEERFFGPFESREAAEDLTIAAAGAGLMGVPGDQVRLTARPLWTMSEVAGVLGRAL